MVTPSFWRAAVWTSFLVVCCFTKGAEGTGDKSPPYLLQPGQFPTQDLSHAISGELIQLDHLNRTGQLRPDRRNDQRTDDYDRPLLFTLLPYGSMRYHGAPAELRDIPLGTHLHGKFYWDPKSGKDGKGAFTQAFLLEDDFSFDESSKCEWRLDDVKLDRNTITVTRLSKEENKTEARPVIYKITPATRVWKGQGFGTLKDLTTNQSLLINLTLCTLKGPGNATDIWIDDESKHIAVKHQTEIHRFHQRTRGLAGWIDAVDNEKGLVTATLFTGFDPALKDDFKIKGRVNALVSEDSLRSYDQINDRAPSELVAINKVSILPGSSGIQLIFKPDNLLEGFRPHKIIRLMSGSWPLDDLPWEERLWK
ncbi:MAG: hypothetical protein JWM04_1049 [Verrucomicrobiales bacterium]|nr:hypothetical protein [Verrucomicrobiales bacterium]